MTQNLFGLQGMNLDCFDSWNCCYTSIEIESAEIKGNEIEFKGSNYWGLQDSIWMGLTLLADLMATGKATASDIIDHCNVKKSYSIYEKAL